MYRLIKDTFTSQLITLWRVFRHMFDKTDTVEYPDEQPYMFPRWRGRIILSRDPDGEERCVACKPVRCCLSGGLHLRYRKPKMRVVDGIRSFFVSIFPAASCVVFAKKPAPPTLFS